MASPSDSAGGGRAAGTDADRPHPDTDPGRGRRIAIDVGSVRIGVASSDPDGILATPVETVPRAKPNARGGRGSDISRIAEIVREYEAVEVIVGLPRTLRGEKGSAATIATAFAEQLRAAVSPVPIRLSDERLTTVSAARALRDSGVRARGQRQVIDQAAAVSILQGWLDERSAVLRSGEAVRPEAVGHAAGSAPASSEDDA
ncbi:putative Holliday junction resolvase [Nocardia brasiliensis NBRC 14402]|uniref:Holliday junction resolvase RuvX n=1 Tax=Nocardia brasiliensis TaxID=37326 RepID=UPI00045C9BA1|nr:Holliday junction resolvase RuvX [Nocardia brasiliensis]ASF06432.1 Holliday junction resolvase RuvX [Nocardia brasiliensis]GAJ86198.1 putative Holliday junction resolvase [Nocardia brasiliensis NBRC 14402]SUB48451.1 Putative Holliday junction resolvase [Nocardia brasiliensis]